MNIIDKKIDDLKPYENNPRKNDKAISPVAESIKNFGFKVPIVIDKNDVIVCGHTRFEAAKKIGMDVVPCIIADDLTDEQIKAFRLADNKVSELSEWDVDLLVEELKDISDIDMTTFAFDVGVFEETTEQKINDGEEIDPGEYDDETFDCECPRCGFRFNR